MNRQAAWVGSLWVLGALSRWIGEAVALGAAGVLWLVAFFWPTRSRDE